MERYWRNELAFLNNVFDQIQVLALVVRGNATVSICVFIMRQTHFDEFRILSKMKEFLLELEAENYWLQIVVVIVIIKLN